MEVVGELFNKTRTHFEQQKAKVDQFRVMFFNYKRQLVSGNVNDILANFISYWNSKGSHHKGWLRNGSRGNAKAAKINYEKVGIPFLRTVCLSPSNEHRKERNFSVLAFGLHHTKKDGARKYRTVNGVQNRTR